MWCVNKASVPSAACNTRLTSFIPQLYPTRLAPVSINRVPMIGMLLPTACDFTTLTWAAVFFFCVKQAFLLEDNVCVWLDEWRTLGSSSSAASLHA